MYIYLIIIAAAAGLFSQLVKIWDEKAKSNAADEELARDAKTIAGLRVLIREGQEADSARERRENQKDVAMLEVQAATQNLKSEYERRLALIEAAPENNKSELRRSFEEDPLPIANLDAKMDEIFATAPAKLAEKLEQQRLIQKTENDAVEQARRLNEKLRPLFEEMAQVLLHTLKRANDKGHVHLSKIPSWTFPTQIIFTAEQSKTSSQDFIEIHFDSGEVMQIFINRGIVPSPPGLNRFMFIADQLDVDGIKYPEFFIQVSTAGGTRMVSGEIRYFGTGAFFQAYGNRYAEWEELNKKYAHQGIVMATNVMLTVLSRLRAENAYEKSPKPETH